MREQNWPNLNIISLEDQLERSSVHTHSVLPSLKFHQAAASLASVQPEILPWEPDKKPRSRRSRDLTARCLILKVGFWTSSWVGAAEVWPGSVPTLKCLLRVPEIYLMFTLSSKRYSWAKPPPRGEYGWRKPFQGLYKGYAIIRNLSLKVTQYLL